MGTNYYLNMKPPCESCGRPYEPKHIGKSSGGWCFSLHVIPEESINDLADWQKIWSAPEATIEDEYGRLISELEMTDIICNRKWEPRSKWSAEEYMRNQAEPGPNGLARHVVGRHCLKHGAGTWDCIEGDFF